MIKNILLLTAASICAGIYLLMALALISAAIPQEPPASLMSVLLFRHQQLVMPEREMMLYRIFILSICIFQAFGLWRFKAALASSETTVLLKRFILNALLWGSIAVFGLFKMAVYGNPYWAKGIFIVGLLGGILSTIFLNEILQIINISKKFLLQRFITYPQWLPNIAIATGIIAIVYVPDVNSLLAKMFLTDHFYHLDTMLTAPGWAHLTGGVLNIDQYTPYAIGAPIVIARVTKLLFGDFNYVTLLQLLMAGIAVYYVCLYILMRHWVGSTLLAAGAIIAVIKWQMFHPGVAPTVFNYPSATIWRYPVDLLFFWFIWKHIHTQHFKWLAASALVAGFALFYMIDTGACLLLTCFIYAAASMLFSVSAHTMTWRQAWVRIVSIGIISIGMTLICLWLVQGSFLWSMEFWRNTVERGALFFLGHGNLPIYKSLVDGKYWAGLIGLIIPIVYIGVFIFTVSMIILKQWPMHRIFTAIIALYGILLYNYYVCRSADTSYYVVIWPFAFVLIAGIKYVSSIYSHWSVHIRWGFFIICLASLLTNHYFLNAPHMINFSSNPVTKPLVPIFIEQKDSYWNYTDLRMSPALKLPVNSLGDTDEKLYTEKDFKDDKALKMFFNKEFDFTEDANLISRMTGPEERVPVISSFETRILMQAKRAPFFYYFQLVESRPMHMRTFNMTSLWTVDRLEKTLRQLDTQRPQYIFLEKILLNKEVPIIYRQVYPELIELLMYIHGNYESVDQGQYLTCMKRKN